MKKVQGFKSSFLYRFVIYFGILILVPIRGGFTRNF